MPEMKLADLINLLELQIRSGSQKLDSPVTGCYVSDLLSDVIGNASEGEVWITRQVHQNIVAVAILKNLAGVIVVMSSEPTEDTLRKAAEEGIPIMVTPLSAFETAGRLYQRLKGTETQPQKGTE